MKNNNLDHFESLIQDALSSHQEPFASSSWDALEKKLPKNKTPLYKSPWLWSAAALIGLAVPLIVMNIDESKKEQNVNVVIEDAIISNNQKSTDVLVSEDAKIAEQPEVANSKLAQLFNETNSTENKVTTPSTFIEPNKNTSSETNPNTSNLTETSTKENGTPTANPTSSFSQSGSSGTNVTIIKPTAEFSISSKEICEGTVVQLITQKQNDVDYLWSFGDGTYSKDQSPSHTYSTSGSFIVSLIVRSSIDNSILTKATDELIVVNPMPKVDFNFELKDNQGIPTTSFINLTDKGYKWNWNTGDGNTYSSKDPDHLYYRKGKYNVTLTVENEFGCTKAFTKPVDIKEDYNLLAPNSFTPNGDGINDLFIPEALRVMDVQFTMTIISINDGVVFESSSLSNPWNGNNQKTGSICGEGTYKWVVSFVNSKGKTEQFSGAVLLLK